ncbi:MAG: hypothetical protein ACP5QN_02940 [Minisyncoccia bacterium]
MNMIKTLTKISIIICIALAINYLFFINLYKNIYLSDPTADLNDNEYLNNFGNILYDLGLINVLIIYFLTPNYYIIWSKIKNSLSIILKKIFYKLNHIHSPPQLLKINN